MMKKSSGFTMIELMITITILGTLTLLTAQSIQQAVKAKVKLQDQIDDVSRMRDALRLLERDINLAYHYRDLEKEIEQLVKKKPANQTQSGGGTIPAGGSFPGGDPGPLTNEAQTQQQEERREVPRRDPETHWVGTEDSLNFVTMNNARTVRNSRQADFIEVGYSLRDCKSLTEGGGSSKCLWRRSSPYVDLDVTKGGDEVALLEHVTEFKLRYMGKGKQDWASSWRTDAQGDAASKGKFPQAVEISVTVDKKIAGKSKKYSMQLIVPIHFPNNPEEGANAQGNQSSWPRTQPPAQ
ncbi:type II secretion system protein GspJ [Bdellovibrio bacteriovorus]|uniref:type II secretion system protein GspJ n=1 Tax=Bdellovibrio bacteriovorus TaxID=959 RepID=UPI0021CFEE86|nr:type II secretion system protein GspJ [Bdellovibrio bacteriovorus]UXR63863.1 type II secretion system protein GspJ [Bdellovibrio bacteriovorus]